MLSSSRRIKAFVQVLQRLDMRLTKSIKSLKSNLEHDHTLSCMHPDCPANIWQLLCSCDGCTSGSTFCVLHANKCNQRNREVPKPAHLTLLLLWDTCPQEWQSWIEPAFPSNGLQWNVRTQPKPVESSWAKEYATFPQHFNACIYIYISTEPYCSEEKVLCTFLSHRIQSKSSHKTRMSTEHSSLGGCPCAPMCGF